MNKVESIVYNDSLKGSAVELSQYEEYCDEEYFYNDIEHFEKICTIDSLIVAIDKINSYMFDVE
ncbi:MAG: hypothetical protein WC974_09115 [Thermoplasmata archaeon]